MSGTVHRYEQFWIGASMLLILVFVGSILVTAALGLAHPPSHVEHLDPAAVQSDPTRWAPGIVPLPDGTIQVTLTARIWSFRPERLELPAGRPILFRIASPDVMHGFQIVGTNVNAMVVPGYVTQVRAVFPRPGTFLMVCNEYCGVGHHNMASSLTIVPEGGAR